MLQLILGILVLLATLWLLIKRHDTRTVLIGSGLLLCLVSFSPMDAFAAFSKRMTTAGLIEAICASMGFAYVMKYTRCDASLVQILTKGLSRLGIFLVPMAVMVTFVISIAIPSAAGVSAAVGATLIPLLIAAKVHPAIAGGAVLSGTLGAVLNPGVAHNAFIANIAKMNVMDLVFYHAPISIACGVICAVSLMIVAMVRKELNYQAGQDISATTTTCDTENPPDEKPHYLHALAPFIPVLLLVFSNAGWLGKTEMNVPAAMLIGSIYALFITRSSASQLTKEFFNGMGSAYANILGIIIAAAVFIEGLQACGIIKSFITLLTQYPEFARWGGTIGPFMMGLITGTGDATAFAFNEAVTPHAGSFGYEIPNLGVGVMLAACLGRNMSPLAGAAIVCAGLAGVNPVDMIKRTAPGMIVAVIVVALFFL